MYGARQNEKRLQKAILGTTRLIVRSRELLEQTNKLIKNSRVGHFQIRRVSNGLEQNVQGKI
jgi:hypothetical protein